MNFPDESDVVIRCLSDSDNLFPNDTWLFIISLWAAISRAEHRILYRHWMGTDHIRTVQSASEGLHSMGTVLWTVSIQALQVVRRMRFTEK